MLRGNAVRRWLHGHSGLIPLSGLDISNSIASFALDVAPIITGQAAALHLRNGTGMPTQALRTISKTPWKPRI